MHTPSHTNSSRNGRTQKNWSGVNKKQNLVKPILKQPNHIYISVNFTLQYHLYPSSRLFPTSQDTWQSIQEPRLFISMFEWKSTDLLSYYEDKGKKNA